MSCASCGLFRAGLVTNYPMRVLLEADKISADERRTCMREMKDCQQRLWRMKTADDDETGTHARQPAEQLLGGASDQKWRKKFGKKQQDVLSTVHNLAEQVEVLQRQVAGNNKSLDRMADAIQSLERALVQQPGAGCSLNSPVQMPTFPSPGPLRPVSAASQLSQTPRSRHRKVAESQDGPRVPMDASESPHTPPSESDCGHTSQRGERNAEEIGRADVLDSLEERVAAREARRRADEQQALILAEATVCGLACAPTLV